MYKKLFHVMLAVFIISSVMAFTSADESVNDSKFILPPQNKDDSPIYISEENYQKARLKMNINRHDIAINGVNVATLRPALGAFHGNNPKLYRGFYITDSKGNGYRIDKFMPKGLKYTIDKKTTEHDIIFFGDGQNGIRYETEKKAPKWKTCAYIIAIPYIVADFEFGKRYQVVFDLRFYNKYDHKVKQVYGVSYLSFFIKASKKTATLKKHKNN